MLKHLVIIASAGLVACSPPSETATSDLARQPAGMDAESSELVLWEWPETPIEDDELVFRQLSAIFSSAGGSIQVANGEEVKLSDWPATLVAETNRGPCTASVIGPTTILTAAHCVDRGGKPARAGRGLITILQNGRETPYAISACTIHPDYAGANARTRLPRNSSDYALCELSGEITSLRYETISISPALSSGSKVLISGWGCTKLLYDPARGIYGETPSGSRTKLTMGNEAVEAVGVVGLIDVAGSYTMTSSPNGFEPSLCPGDSGGPLLTGASLETQKAPRRIVAVNSAVGARLIGGKLSAFESFYAPLSSDAFVHFLESYAPRSGASGASSRVICGWTQDAGIGGCRE